MTYHAGERWVQQQAGVREEAEGLTKIISTTLNKKAQKFLQEQCFAIASTVDSQGWVWASLLLEKPGFIKIIGDRKIAIPILSVQDHLLRQNLDSCSDLGILVIDLANRRRLRLNGQAALTNENITLTTEQVYFNCPKYIQKRHLARDTAGNATEQKVQQWETLPAKWEKHIANADTFFIASWHPESGADASHRGGNPGFIQLPSYDTLMFPDYVGNNMFNTLGNLVKYPQAGLLFLDFEKGDQLQIAGKAEIIWHQTDINAFSGAKRLIRFKIHRVQEISVAPPVSWEFVDYSPFNP
jgi:hypothetical protein